MSEDKIIVSVLPFENPKNDAEKRLNDEAMKFYLSVEKREAGEGITAYVMNPDHPGHMYRCMAGWTEQGWRTHATCMDVEQMNEYVAGAVLAEAKMHALGSELKREQAKNN